jgi:hypothetical protein
MFLVIYKKVHLCEYVFTCKREINKLMNIYLLEVLHLTPYHFTVGGITSKNYSMSHYGMEIGKIN